MKRSLIIEIIAALLILLFVYAATNKLMDYQKFKIQLGQSPVLVGFAPTVAWLVPAIEIIIAFLLATPKTRLLGLYASFALMLSFTAYIIIILNFSEHVPCSCGGILEKLGWKEHLIFNIIYTLIALAGILLSKNILLRKRTGQAENL